jgi:hypothetical protein
VREAAPLVIYLLLAVSAEIPAGQIAEMRKEGMDAGLIERLLGDELGLVVLLGDGVEALDRDSAKGLTTLRDTVADGQVIGGIHDRENNNRDAQNAQLP